MTTAAIRPSHVVSTARTAAPRQGGWRVAPGRALALRPACDGTLRVLTGRAWVTLDGPHAGFESGPQGDVWLCAGDALVVPAGQRAVVEAGAAQEALSIDWRVAAGAVDAPSWQCAVAEPAHDLSRATGDALHASARLAGGLLRWLAGRLVGSRHAVRAIG